MDSEPPPKPGRVRQPMPSPVVDGAMPIILIGGVAALGWLWVMGSHRLFGSSVFSTVGGLVAFVSLLAVIGVAAWPEPWNRNQTLVIRVFTGILLVPAAWALLWLLQWAWANPMF